MSDMRFRAEMTIGRTEGNDLQIYHEAVSRRHCLLRYTDGVLTVEDLNSSTGTFVSGRRIHRAVVSPGDEIKLAGVITLDWEHPVLAQWLNSAGVTSTTSLKRKLNPFVWIAPSAALLTALIVAISTGGFTGGHISSGSGSGLTDNGGRVYFTDGGTGEQVEISVVDEIGRPLDGVQVDFVDGDGFETFVAFDSESGLSPSLRIFPHNSSHEIEMFTEVVGPMVREAIPGSEYYDTVNLFSLYLEDCAEGIAEPGSYSASTLPDNWMYRGVSTQEQLDRENQMLLMVLRLTPVGEPMSMISETGGQIMDVLDEMDLVERPDEYHVFIINPSSGESGNMAGTIFFTMPVGQEWDANPVIDSTSVGNNIAEEQTAVASASSVEHSENAENEIPLNYCRDSLRVVANELVYDLPLFDVIDFHDPNHSHCFHDPGFSHFALRYPSVDEDYLRGLYEEERDQYQSNWDLWSDYYESPAMVTSVSRIDVTIHSDETATVEINYEAQASWGLVYVYARLHFIYQNGNWKCIDIHTES